MGVGKVLVVDDNAYARQAVGLLLTKAGYDVVEAEDGAQAIQVMASEDHASDIDTVICDLDMPTMNGSQTLSYFKAHYPLIPLIILTGAPDFVLTDVLAKQGITDYLLKPVSEKRLLETVRVNVRLHELRQRQGGGISG
ncbi:MAG: response regulator [Nitrospiraceae bacterium]